MGARVDTMAAIGEAKIGDSKWATRSDNSTGINEPLVEVCDLEVSFPHSHGAYAAVGGVSFTIRRQSTLVLVGESGSGKSVTARALMGLLDPNLAKVSGSVKLEGTELIGLSEKAWGKYRGGSIGIVFQDPMRSLNPTMRIGVQITEGMRRHLGLTHKAAETRAIELLDLVGIPFPAACIHEYPYQLSGGMRQRVMMAMAIASKPKVLIADEPTTALDVTTQAQIMELLMNLQREFEMGVLLITHDMGLAFSYGDEIAVMYAGRIVEQSSAFEFAGNVKMPYTKGLLDSVPRLTDAPRTRFAAMHGRPPDASDMPSGCSFEPRCGYAQSRCRGEVPPLTLSEGNHRYACWYPL